MSVLCSTKELLASAENGRFAVGAFNISNLEVLQAVVTAAEQIGAPAIIAMSESAIAYGGFENLVTLARTAAQNSKMSFAVHLDHGRNRDLISRCIREGFTSVMFDGSDLPFEENVRRTVEVVREAAEFGVSVEGELGRLLGIEDEIKVTEGEELFTDPRQAGEFAEKTGVDALAVAIGTSHGPYKFKGKPRLDLERLKEIKKSVRVPLVLHGASGVGEEAVRKAKESGISIEGARGLPDEALIEAIKLGIRKVNIDTDMRLAFTTGLRTVLNGDPGLFDPRKILSGAREAVLDVVKTKMELFMSACSV